MTTVTVRNESDLAPWYALQIAAKQFGDGEKSPETVVREQEEIVCSRWYTVRRNGYTVAVAESAKPRGGRGK